MLREAIGTEEELRLSAAGVMLREVTGTEEELRLSEVGVMLSDGSEMSVSTTGWETDNASRTSCGVGPPS